MFSKLNLKFILQIEMLQIHFHLIQLRIDERLGV